MMGTEVGRTGRKPFLMFPWLSSEFKRREIFFKAEKDFVSIQGWALSIHFFLNTAYI